MYIGFSKTLVRWGGIRIGVGKRMRGAAGVAMLLIYAMLQFCWWLCVGTLWLLYGVGYVCIYLPVKLIAKAVRSLKQKLQKQ